MTSGADLFVVCKQCGSEVSPYITECPYCGSRLRRRAPKLPRVHAPSHPARHKRLGSLLRGRRRGRAGVLAGAPASASDRWAYSRPYMTIVLVVLSCAVWIAIRAEAQIYLKLAIAGPLHGDWWRLVTSEFADVRGLPAFLVIATIAIFGWLLERRHGPLVTAALFLGGGVSGGLVALAVYRAPGELIVGQSLVIIKEGLSTANAAALALLAAWAGPDLRALRSGSYYEGDLLGAAAIGALLLALPFAFSQSELSWLAGVVGAAFGLLVGLGVQLRGEARA
jgi:membrane associated rhomboid family serine protease